MVYKEILVKIIIILTEITEIFQIKFNLLSPGKGFLTLALYFITIKVKYSFLSIQKMVDDKTEDYFKRMNLKPSLEQPRFCREEVGQITYCVKYNKPECPKTCSYAIEKSKRERLQNLLNDFS